MEDEIKIAPPQSPIDSIIEQYYSRLKHLPIKPSPPVYQELDRETFVFFRGERTPEIEEEIDRLYDEKYQLEVKKHRERFAQEEDDYYKLTLPKYRAELWNYKQGLLHYQNTLKLPVQRYLEEWVLAKYGTIELMTIEGKNQSVKVLDLETIFVPLTIENSESREIKFAELPNYRHAIITGEPGSGKTIILRHIAQILSKSILEHKNFNENEPSFFPLPIFVSLPLYAKYLHELPANANVNQKALPAFISWQLSEMQTNFDLPPDFFDKLFYEGETIFLLLDGLDEIPQEFDRRKIRAIIKNLVSSRKSMHVIISCRQSAYKGTEMVLSGFDQINVLPLREQETEAIIRKSYRSIYQDQEIAEKKTVELLQTIQSLQDTNYWNNQSIPLLISTPLLVRILLEVHFSEHAQLKKHRVQIYKEVIDMMLLPKYSAHEETAYQIADSVGGDVRTHRTILQHIAFNMHSRGETQGIEIDEDELRNIFESKAFTPTLIESFIALVDLRGTLFFKKENGMYSFVYHQFQEYLAACYVAEILRKSLKIEGIAKYILEKGLVTNSWWREPILLMAGYLYVTVPGTAKTFLKSLVAPPQDLSSYSSLPRMNVPHTLLIQLNQAINDSYNLDELKLLCFKLNIEYENLPGDRKDIKVQELVRLVEQQNRIPLLIETIKGERPQITSLSVDSMALENDLEKGKLSPMLQVLAAELAATILLEWQDPQDDLLEMINERLNVIFQNSTNTLKHLRPEQRTLIGYAIGRLGDKRETVTKLEKLELCYVLGGDFYAKIIPSSNDEEELEQETKSPLKSTHSYWLSRYPITNAQFLYFVQSGGYKNASYWEEASIAQFWQDGKVKGRFDQIQREQPNNFGHPFNLPNHPVVGITWYEAVAFTHWLTEKWHQEGIIPTNVKIRLPSEDEWEKAARGGLSIPNRHYIVSALHLKDFHLSELTLILNTNSERIFPWGINVEADRPIPEQFNYKKTGIGTSNAVGCFPGGSSPYGCEEMCGNVSDWTSNYDIMDQNDIRNQSESLSLDTLQSVRGGYFDADADACQCISRSLAYKDFISNYISFRILI